MNSLQVMTPNTSPAVISFNADLFDRFINYTDVKETTLKGYAVCIRAFIKYLSFTFPISIKDSPSSIVLASSKEPILTIL